MSMMAASWFVRVSLGTGSIGGRWQSYCGQIVDEVRKHRGGIRFRTYTMIRSWQQVRAPASGRMDHCINNSAPAQLSDLH